MKSILITGAQGQLGKEIVAIKNQFIDFVTIATDINELNILNPDEISNIFKNNNIEYIINCAAYTAVDKAEQESEKAYALNTKAVKYLTEAAIKYNSKLIHISTDYVFDGTNYKPYNELDKSNPNSEYGKSKLAGEIEITNSNVKAIIIRTSWLYSIYGNNFVKTMVKYGNERNSLNIVFDQIGTPTHAKDLAQAIQKIICSKKTIDFEERHIFHYSNEGITSWYDFAKKIMQLKNINCKINPIESHEYPPPTPRPYYSVLNKKKIKSSFALEIPHWEKSLSEIITSF